MEKAELEGWMVTTGALQRGHFVLSSGLHSPAYVQCALLLESPTRAEVLGGALAARLQRYRPEAVLAPALGGLIIGFEVASALGVPFRFTERQAGEMQLRRGFQFAPGERTVVIEDVVTTGKSSLEALNVARSLEAEICAVGSILDRSGRSDPFGEIPFINLLSVEFPTYKPDVCPLCDEGVVISKPGSRPES